MNRITPISVIASCILITACKNESLPSISEQNVVSTLAAYTLEAYQLPTETPPTEIPAEEDPSLGPSIEVTQQLEAAPDPAITGESGALPPSHYIWNIWGHRQYFGIGCEASAAVDWADYFGVPVSEFKFQARLPFSDNPDLGFVGSVDGPWGQVPPYAYGVHAAPIAAVLKEYYGMNAVGVKGFTIEEIQREIASGQPVIAWVIGNCVGGIPYDYIDEQGTAVTVAAYEHVVILTGYDEETLRYMNNGKFYDIPYANFENTWSVLGNMVVYLAD